jgi:hypothetical protein
MGLEYDHATNGSVAHSLSRWVGRGYAYSSNVDKDGRVQCHLYFSLTRKGKRATSKTGVI